jgi:selenophosphate synthase
VEDDAAVYRLREDLAIVVSVDYFNPIVREAYLFRHDRLWPIYIKYY